MFAILRFVRSRLARRGERIVLVGVGIAAGAAMLAAVLAGSLVAQDRSLSRAAARLDAGDRAVRAVWGGIPAQAGVRWQALDGVARTALGRLAHPQPIAVMLYRENAVAGHVIDLGAIDDLGRWVQLRSGRLPHRCRPERCEVIQLAGSGPVPSAPGLRLVRVGTGSLVSPLPLGAFVTPGASDSILSSARAYHRSPSPPFLLANGVSGLASVAPLADDYRSYGWIVPLERGMVHPWSLGRFQASVVRTRSALAARSSFFDVTAPTDELDAAAATARVAARRLLVLGGEAAALLLAFTILAAASLRRDAGTARMRLTWYGARPWQLALFSLAEAAAVAALAAIAGWAAGAGVGALVAARAGSPGGAVLAHSLVSGVGLAAGAGLVVAATVVLLVALLVRPIELGRLSISAVDVAALGALAAIALALARGEADAQSLAGQRGTAALLLLLPALVAFVVGVAWTRLLVPALRALDRVGRRGAVSLRLAALSLARNPGHAAIAVGFLVVSLGLALFGEVYRSTLARGQSDQAAYAVPLDFVVREDLTKLVPLAQAAPPSHYGALGAVPVLRLSGEVSRLTGARGFTLLGLPAEALTRLRGWRDDFSPLSRAELAGRLAPPAPVRLRGVPVRRELQLPVSVRGGALTLDAQVKTPRGDFVSVHLGTAGSGRHVLRASVPRPARDGLLVSLTLRAAGLAGRGPPGGGQNTEPGARGVLTVGGAVDSRSWTGANGVRALGRHRFRYVVGTELDTRLRVKQPTDGRPVPVVVSPRLAAAAGPGGILPLEFAGQPLLVRVVGTVRRFPTVDDDVVAADLSTVATALNADVPGSAVTNELWLDAHGSPGRLAAELRRPPLSSLEVVSRQGVLGELRSDPLARGTLVVLVAAALAALALAVLGLLLGLVADLRDEGGELFDLEAQGVGPRALKRHLRLRTLVVATSALAGGVAAGAGLAGLVVRLVTVTAQATAPEPPLVLVLDWRVVGLALLAYAVLVAAVAAGATAAAFRSRAAGRLREAGP
jgi:hypothetical protein